MIDCKLMTDDSHIGEQSKKRRQKSAHGDGSIIEKRVEWKDVEKKDGTIERVKKVLLYEVRLTVYHPDKGKRAPISKYAKTYPEARRLLKQLRADEINGKTIVPSSLTLGECVSEYLEDCVKGKHDGNNTYADYKSLMDNQVISSSLAKIKLKDIQPAHFNKFYNSIRKIEKPKKQNLVVIRKMHLARNM